jgi:hypothetical protein
MGGETKMVTATPNASSLAEVLDRILDKGVVVDVWARISLVGIEILTVESRVVVASVDTFLHYSEEMAKIEQAAIGATPKVPA